MAGAHHVNVRSRPIVTSAFHSFMLYSVVSQDIITGWKKWFAVGLGFGVGVAVITAAIFVCVSWYSSRPKQWDNRDITATFSAPLFDFEPPPHNNGGEVSLTGTELEYIIDNNTLKDFTLSPDQPFFLQDGGALRHSTTGEYKISDPCFVPAKNKVKCRITVPPDFDTTFSVDGFAIFDNVGRYNIIFPKPTGPTPDDRKRAPRNIQKLLTTQSKR